MGGESGERRAQLCHRCLMRLEPAAGGVDLPRRIRATLADHGLGERVRLSLTGCLGYCPTGRVSMQLYRGDEASDFLALNPARDGEELLERLSREQTGSR